jgi:hypothetical protein
MKSDEEDNETKGESHRLLHLFIKVFVSEE